MHPPVAVRHRIQRKSQSNVSRGRPPYGKLPYGKVLRMQSRLGP